MNVTIIRSNRKTIALQVHPDLTVTVRAPKRMWGSFAGETNNTTHRDSSRSHLLNLTGLQTRLWSIFLSEWHILLSKWELHMGESPSVTRRRAGEAVAARAT